MTTSKKKTSVKKTIAKKPAKTGPKLTEASRVYRVAGSGDPQLKHRLKARNAVPADGIAAKDLCEKAECRMVTIAALIRRGFVEIRG